MWDTQKAKMSMFEFNAKPLDLADYPRALASLREPSLLGEIKELAYEQDLPRLRVALEAGVFDAKPFIDKALASPMSAAAIQDHWVGRCSAMMAVMGLVTVSQEAEGVEGRRYALEFNLNDDTKAFMVEYLGHLAQQAKLWRDQMGPTMTDASAVAVNQGMHLGPTRRAADVARRMPTRGAPAAGRREDRRRHHRSQAIR